MYIAYEFAKSRANAGLYDNVYEYGYDNDYDYVNDYESGGKSNNYPPPREWSLGWRIVSLSPPFPF